MSKVLVNVANYSKERISLDNINVQNYVTTDNLLQNKQGKVEAEKMPKQTANTVTRYDENDILIANIRPYLKKIWFANCSGGSSSDVLTLKVKKGYSPKFIYYSLFRDEFFDYMMAGSKGTKMPRGDKNQILDFPIPNFELNYQKQIAKVLSDLDAKIELNNKINQELEALAKTIYDYWFVQFDFPDQNGKPYKSSGGKMVFNEELKREIPEGWEVSTLEKHLSFNRGISYTSKSTATGKGMPMINLKSFNLNGSYRIDGLKYYDGKVNDNKLVAEGDLLIAITDVTRNAEIIGKGIIVPSLDEDKMVASCDISSVICGEKLNKHYLRFLFNSQYYHDYIKHFASGTLVLHLDLNGVSWYKDVLPPIELQNKFGDFVNQYHLKGELIRKENQKLAALRDWLLPMLMNGQVRVAHSDDKRNHGEVKEQLGMVAEENTKYGKG